MMRFPSSGHNSLVKQLPTAVFHCFSLEIFQLPVLQVLLLHLFSFHLTLQRLFSQSRCLPFSRFVNTSGVQKGFAYIFSSVLQFVFVRILFKILSFAR